jgi:hypothetical protein
MDASGKVDTAAAKTFVAQAGKSFKHAGTITER